MHNVKRWRMARLTISLSDERHTALKEAAARRRKKIGELIEESLEHYGIKNHEEARVLVAKARARARLKAGPALDLAVSETRASRRRK
jgi:hypothetical protein